MLAVADRKLIPAKTGAGEADLQARDVHFNNYTFLKQGEKQNDYRTLLWKPGARLALSRCFPNLNVNDPVWRKLLRDVRFRRALSLAIDRSLINQVALLRPGDRDRTTPCCRRARCSARRTASAGRSYDRKEATPSARRDWA